MDEPVEDLDAELEIDVWRLLVERTKERDRARRLVIVLEDEVALLERDLARARGRR